MTSSQSETERRNQRRKRRHSDRHEKARALAGFTASIILARMRFSLRQQLRFSAALFPELRDHS